MSLRSAASPLYRKISYAVLPGQQPAFVSLARVFNHACDLILGRTALRLKERIPSNYSSLSEMSFRK